MKVWGQSACPEVKQKYKKKSCKAVYMSVVYLIPRTCDVSLYKSVKSSSCKGRVVCVKYESLGQTTSYWVGQDKQAGYKISMSKGRAQSNSRRKRGWTYLRGAARNSSSSMYKCI
jgi:hypothetical protein